MLPIGKRLQSVGGRVGANDGIADGVEVKGTPMGAAVGRGVDFIEIRSVWRDRNQTTASVAEGTRISLISNTPVQKISKLLGKSCRG